MKKQMLVALTVIVTIGLFGWFVTTAFFIKEDEREIHPRAEQRIDKEWLYEGILKNFVQSEGKEFHSLDGVLEYNEEDRTFLEQDVGIGETNLVVPYVISNDGIKLYFDEDIDIIDTFYSIHFNRDEFGEWESWCDAHDTPVQIEDGKQVVALKFNNSYHRGELKNIRIYFGKVD